ncbi:MAG: phosphoserine phosphatase SerB [Phenylobacterium sp. RIFCSPHIGHO2_01_FULL_69_31]|jgi:phosphoserine phosphatase|uniref:phosphoserine phosphatase SerB n=1 Tax=Phenylobacterium sp. RIFCSPHIGHO2_01_FULL_69_31 TaxID=1801944 RepID=UPI0008D7C138|nr:phosphoserine phosphatase SerB [Phenylobacterium sp. RIFCSPHIGHO2_01_FULL_69_31]OHB28870.1 MAG: phosphoserine phosphatase SerB [Phenylobacterium sp. RIFCSPHIGHO2_01_FULL_69_31]
MELVLTLVGPDPAQAATAAGRASSALAAVGAGVKAPTPLGDGALDIPVIAAPADVRARVEEALADVAVDACLQPAAGRRKRLLIADMDSTIINVECIDELADFAGVKAQVSEITERAMRGELDFEGALKARVAMLKGLPLADLQRAYDERVRLNPGARTLVRTMTAHGAKAFLVSGGFNFFTRRVAEAAGFDANRANTLIEADGVLAGRVGEPILGREAKLAALKEEAANLGIPLSQTLAVGDGANDLAMIEAAGLGVAYRAKPIVAAQADAKVDHADLTALLYFQGYRADQFVTD